MERLYSLEEVAEILQIPLRTLYQWRSRNVAPRGIRVGRHVRVSESELQKWLDERADPQPA